ncbi:hypothetical protein SARC_01743 [Sphaeroforma arctica JP610]|uniref:DUF985 domain-containing protein n=1 Tax=Sphaeroforma arctica JP610 TaxID=667725 RepID=A0A0L0GCY6_9EUKA|nr:hypothetical protein SARC_01743 [Sphaeroforma arctica JP610]KNC86083.1 hypothetical protein SARC_01743 [Sphaeroforma arctica JP610]|eukprot:XP_014159985.1 hypothetical protein SARC_01743 [Sphaeroforma arctica JP610]
MVSEGDCDGRLAKFDVGFDVKNHVFPLATVPKGVWFAAEPDPDCEAYSLMGATVAPGFNYTDWSIATKPQLIEALGGEGNVCDEYMKVVDRLVAKDLEETDR